MAGARAMSGFSGVAPTAILQVWAPRPLFLWHCMNCGVFLMIPAVNALVRGMVRAGGGCNHTAAPTPHRHYSKRCRALRAMRVPSMARARSS